MFTNNFPNHSTSEQSLSDGNHDLECAQPQLFHPTHKIQTSFEELCVQETDHSRKFNTKILVSKLQKGNDLSILLILATEAQGTNQSKDDTITTTELGLPLKTGPVPPIIISDVNRQESSQPAEETIKPVTNTPHETHQEVASNVGQPIEINTGHRIQDPRVIKRKLKQGTRF